jgi:hypothetical protein
MTRLLLVVAGALLAGCASRPPAPDWEVESRGALDRYVGAFMAGDDRVAQVEFARARASLAATGRAGLVARAELTRCALQLASLQVGPCPGFDPLRADAPPPERAYAAYLAGEATDAALLPEAHRRVAGGASDAASLPQDPLARVIAAGVLLRTGRASPPVIEAAVETASAQGWRRPLLAWLGVQAQRAQAAGDADAVQRIRRRMALVAGES